MKFSQTLLSHVKRQKSQLRIPDWINLPSAIDEMVFAYHCCIASEQLLLTAADACKDGDTLGDYYRAHFLEEKDEINILTRDLNRIGATFTGVNELAAGMIGSQYYFIKHVDPVCLLGYLMIQEADPLTLEQIEQLESLHGEGNFEFFRFHAVKDRDHKVELMELVDTVSMHRRPLLYLAANNAFEFLRRK